VETFYDIARVANDRYLPTRFSTILGAQNAGVYQVGIEQKVADILRMTNNYPTFDFFVQVGGGASGEVITAQQAEEVKLSGCGSIGIYAATTTSQQFLSQIFNFYAKESCGKCTPCREGSWQLKQMIENLEQNSAVPWTRIAAILAVMEQSSFCGLGKSIALPIKSYAKNILKVEI
jgi:NADH:ubiquinone oxidoreductase subunit F (NADH-binding)